LECFIGVLEAYFGEVTENTIRDNFEIVYMVSYPARISLILCWILLQYLTAALQLIEEMLDEGHPMTTEPNMLKDIVLPPTLVRKLLTAAGVSG
jgi:AP-3 complex subunit mu